jgi:hydroxylamine reductase
MFCYQCEQTAKGRGCEKIGVCGKEPGVAAFQDLPTHAMKGLALY